METRKNKSLKQQEWITYRNQVRKQEWMNQEAKRILPLQTETTILQPLTQRIICHQANQQTQVASTATSPATQTANPTTESIWQVLQQRFHPQLGESIPQWRQKRNARNANLLNRIANYNKPESAVSYFVNHIIFAQYGTRKGLKLFGQAIKQ